MVIYSFIILFMKGDYFLQNINEENNMADTSTSSLRRKLFFQGDRISPPSPVR